MEVSYHSVLTKNQKLQNYKNKKNKKKILCTGQYYPKSANIAGI